MRYRTILTFAALALGSVPLAAAAGTYGGKIVVPIDLPRGASASKAAIADLRSYLSQMTDRPFDVGPEPSDQAIVLSLRDGLAASSDARRALAGKGIDAFYIHADKNRMAIVANDEHGLSNGIYFYLEALGVRWLLMGKHWTDVPHRSDIALKMDRLVVPAFKARGFAGTGGPYSWKWGHTYEGSEHLVAASQDWMRRLRYGGEMLVGKSVGEAFIVDPQITSTLAAHPDYLAIIDGHPTPLHITGADGKPVLNVTAKVNAANPAAVALFCNWASKSLRDKGRRGDASEKIISVEPSDGFSYGNNLAALPGNGSGSDQTFFIANQCARMVRKEVRSASVILLAYAGHAEPPTFDLEPNVIVQVTPYAFQYSMTPEQFITTWRQKARRLSLYDYWSIPDGSFDEPTFDYPALPAKLRYWRANHIEGIQVESTYSGGAMGLAHYLASHLMWDIDADESALLADWFDRAFGPAKGPMRRMLERWSGSFRLTSVDLHYAYADLAEAARLASGSPKVAARVDDYIRYVHYMRLRKELEDDPDPASRSRKAVALTEYLLDINDTFMVGTTREVDLYQRKYPAIFEDFDAIGPGKPTPGWARVRTLTHADVAALLADGVRSYPDPGFELRRYSDRLVFVTPGKAQAVAAFSAAWGVAMPTIGELEVTVVIPKGADALALRISRMVDNEITVRDGEGKAVATAKIAKVNAPHPLEVMQDVRLPLAPGRYKLQFRPDGSRATGYFTFQTPANIPVTFTSFLSHKGGASPRLYFYVPAGVHAVAMYYPLGDFNDVFHFQVLDPSGRAAPISYRDNRRLLVVAVPPGQDGKTWSMLHSVSPDDSMQMLNVPQAFSLSPDLLMTSIDALPADKALQ